MTDLHADLRAIEIALSTIRTPAMPGEYDLHAEVADALQRAALPHLHEFKLAPRCRIDFLVGHIGIEIKKGRPTASALREQLTRYLKSDALDAMIVVTQRTVPLPPTICGKPIRLLALNSLWGVALP